MQFFLGTKLNLLLISLPLAAAARLSGWGDGATCVLSMIALIPLAEVRCWRWQLFVKGVVCERELLSR